MAIPQSALDLQTKVQKVVLAGMKMMYDPATFKMLLEGITGNMPLPQKMAMEVAGVMKIVDDKSANGLPPDVLAPASMLLLYELAGFMKESGAGNPTKEDMQAALQILQKVIVEIFTKTGKAVTGGKPPVAPQQPQQAGLIGQQQQPEGV